MVEPAAGGTSRRGRPAWQAALTAKRHVEVKPAADAGGQTITICLSTTAVDELKRYTTSAVNRKAATAAGAKTATPAISS